VLVSFEWGLVFLPAAYFSTKEDTMGYYCSLSRQEMQLVAASSKATVVVVEAAVVRIAILLFETVVFTNAVVATIRAKQGLTQNM
jgi:hypothetical protein